MTDERTPEDELGEELEMDGEDQDSGHDGAQVDDEDLDDELAEQEEDEEQERDEAAPRSSAVLPPVRGNRPGTRAAASTPARTGVAHSEDELPCIDDRASKIWVAAILAVFALILVYGLLFGKSGALTPPTPSPVPTPSRTPAASVTAAPSPSITPIPSVTVAPSVTAAPTVAPSPTAAPSAS
jgi:hypothetical protein